MVDKTPEQEQDAPIESTATLSEVVITSPEVELFNISGFVSQVADYGLAKTNRFTIICPVPKGLSVDSKLNNLITIKPVSAQKLRYVCEAAEFPGRSLNLSEIRTYGPSFKTPTMSIYPDITLTFLCDSYLSQKEFFDTWLDLINPNTSFDFAYREDYVVNLDIFQLDETGEKTFNMRLREAYPVSIAPLASNWADDGFHRIQVTFTYRYYTILQIVNDTSEQNILEQFLDIFRP